MTQEDKELLLKDLCVRLPFKVKVEAKGLHKVVEDDYNNMNIIAHVLLGLNLRDSFKTYAIDYSDKLPLFNRRTGDCNIKPYLFPLSNMTEEQKKEFASTLKYFPDEEIDFWTTKTSDWCDKNHFDYRGLIPMGLAIDATGLGIYE